MAGDDSKLPPSIHDELARLNGEMKRLRALPVDTAERRQAVMAMLQSFRQEFRDRMKSTGEEQPAWRQVSDASMERAVDGIIGVIQRDFNRTGQLQIDPNLIQQQMAPVLADLGAVLQKGLVEKFGQPQTPGAPPQTVNGTDVAAMLFTLFGPPAKK